MHDDLRVCNRLRVRRISQVKIRGALEGSFLWRELVLSHVWGATNEIGLTFKFTGIVWKLPVSAIRLKFTSPYVVAKVRIKQDFLKVTLRILIRYRRDNL